MAQMSVSKGLSKVLPVLKSTVFATPKLMGAFNLAINTIFSVSVATAVAHKATDGASTNNMMNFAEAVIGEKGVRAVGGAVRYTANYVGEGLVGVGQNLNERYPAQQASQRVFIPPISRPGFLVESALGAAGNRLAAGEPPAAGWPGTLHGFQNAAYGGAAAPSVEPLAMARPAPPAVPASGAGPKKV